MMWSVLLLLSDLLETGAACTDPQSNGWICWPQEASSGKITENSLHPALKHSYTERQMWPAEECRARLRGAQGQAVEELDASCRAAGNCR